MYTQGSLYPLGGGDMKFMGNTMGLAPFNIKIPCIVPADSAESTVKFWKIHEQSLEKLHGGTAKMTYLDTSVWCWGAAVSSKGNRKWFCTGGSGIRPPRRTAGCPRTQRSLPPTSPAEKSWFFFFSRRKQIDTNLSAYRAHLLIKRDCHIWPSKVIPFNTKNKGYQIRQPPPQERIFFLLFFSNSYSYI